MDPTIDPAAYVYARAYLATPERWSDRRRWIAAATAGGGVANPARDWAWIRDSDDVAAAIADLVEGAEALGVVAHGEGEALGSNPYAEDGEAGRAWAVGWLGAREAARPARPQGREDDPEFAAFLADFEAEEDARPSGWDIIPPVSEWIRPPRPEGRPVGLGTARDSVTFDKLQFIEHWRALDPGAGAR